MKLVRLAQQSNPNPTIVSQTLPEKNASVSILEKIGFQLDGSVEHPHDGTVWELQFDQRRASSGASD